MKKILKMIEKFEAEGETLKISEDKIIEAIAKLVEKNAYFKKQFSLAENCDEKCHLSSNDMDGVDYQISFEIKELGLDFNEEFLKLAVEKCVDHTGVYYDSKNDCLVSSTSEEIFMLTHDKQILLPNEERETYLDDFHAWLIAEDYMETSGYYPGIYSSGYHGDVDNFKFDEDYKTFFPEDESKQKKDKLKDFLSLYDVKKAIDDGGYSYDLESSFPDKMFDMLPQELKDLQFNGEVTVYAIDSITPEKVVFRIELSQTTVIRETTTKLVDAKYNIHEVELSLIPNSLRFILSTDEKTSGGILEMSLLPIG